MLEAWAPGCNSWEEQALTRKTRRKQRRSDVEIGQGSQRRSEWLLRSNSQSHLQVKDIDHQHETTSLRIRGGWHRVSVASYHDQSVQELLETHHGERIGTKDPECTGAKTPQTMGYTLAKILQVWHPDLPMHQPIRWESFSCLPRPSGRHQDWLEGRSCWHFRLVTQIQKLPNDVEESSHPRCQVVLGDRTWSTRWGWLGHIRQWWLIRCWWGEH